MLVSCVESPNGHSGHGSMPSTGTEEACGGVSLHSPLLMPRFRLITMNSIDIHMLRICEDKKILEKIITHKTGNVRFLPFGPLPSPTNSVG